MSSAHDLDFDLRHLRHLSAVHRHGTLQAAADRLHLSQSALTKSIGRLEDALGASLFDRRGRRLVLNALGERVLARGERLLRGVDDLVREVELHKGGSSGQVRVGVGPVVALSHLPDALARFVPEHREVQLTIRGGATPDLVPRLLDGELDFVVADRELARTSDEVEARLLPVDGIGAAVRPGHPLLCAGRHTFEELASYPRGGGIAPPRFAQWLRGLNVSARAVADITCDNYETLALTAERTDMIVMGPERVLTRYLDSGRLVRLSFPLPGAESQPAVLSCAQRPRSPAVEAFMAAFLDGCDRG